MGTLLMWPLEYDYKIDLKNEVYLNSGFTPGENANDDIA